MSKEIIAVENAEKQLNLLMDYYEISVDEIADDDQKQGLRNSIKSLTKAIQTGRVEIKLEDDTPIVYQNLKKPVGDMHQIKYNEITGRAKIAMKDNKENDHYGRMYSFLGGLSGHGATVIMKLKGKDLSIAEYLGVFFLAV